MTMMHIGRSGQNRIDGAKVWPLRAAASATRFADTARHWLFRTERELLGKPIYETSSCAILRVPRIMETERWRVGRW